MRRQRLDQEASTGRCGTTSREKRIAVDEDIDDVFGVLRGDDDRSDGDVDIVLVSGC